MFRQAWTWSQNWYEPAIVGAAVALFGLAYLLPLANDQTESLVPSSEAPPTAYSLGLYDIPQGEQFYREKWIAEANAFYAANPPKNTNSANAPARQDSASMVIPASARMPVQPDAIALQDEPEIAQSASIVTSQGESPPLGIERATQANPIRAQAVMALPAHAQRWRVVTCLAAGLLASLLFVSIWPANAFNEPASPSMNHQADLVGRGEVIPVRIPSAWIGLRPTLRQTVRRGVLSGSYLIAAIGAWGIVS